MGANRTNGEEINSDAYVEIITDTTADFLTQNPSPSETVRIVYAAALPDPDFVGGFVVPPYATWGRFDAANTPILQGKVYAIATGKLTLPILE